MSSMDPAQIVQEGYDVLDDTYRNWVATMDASPRWSFLADVLERIPPGCDVLEVGCGPGTDAVALSTGRRYTGIDLSAVQLAHARALVPEGTFLHANVLEVQLPPASFDAVVAFYVFVHIPADRLGELFRRIASWLRPGGWLCATFGTSEEPGMVQPMWLGAADMYFSSLSPQRSDELLGEAGFTIETAETITEIEEGEGPATFRWVKARRSARGSS